MTKYYCEIYYWVRVWERDVLSICVIFFLSPCVRLVKRYFFNLAIYFVVKRQSGSLR